MKFNSDSDSFLGGTGNYVACKHKQVAFERNLSSMSGADRFGLSRLFFYASLLSLFNFDKAHHTGRLIRVISHGLLLKVTPCWLKPEKSLFKDCHLKKQIKIKNDRSPASFFKTVQI